MSSFGIEVNFLTGRYVATCYNDRRMHEWPPHPARLFSALVATWADADEPSQPEREALEWLAALAPPGIDANREAAPRKVVSHFVPVNDTAIISRSLQEKRAKLIRGAKSRLHDELVSSDGEVTRKARSLQNKLAGHRDLETQVTTVGTTPPKTAAELFPDGRSKQERFFPSVTLRPPPRVTYIWNEPLPDAMKDVLDGLLGRLARLGHSSSLISSRLTLEPPCANWIPQCGESSLRAVRAGQLAELERRFAQHRGISPRSLPHATVRYGDQASVEQDSSTFQAANTAGEWIVFEFAHDCRAFPATRAVEVATKMRAAVLSHAEDPIPEGLTGHRPDRAPTTEPHVAFLPLPFAGYPHANGRLLGVAVAVPAGTDVDSRRALYRAIGRWEGAAGSRDFKLTFGRGGEIRMKRQRERSALVSLRPSSWSGRSRTWTSVTPIALPKHPGRLSGGTHDSRVKAWRAARAAVVAAVRHVGLPDPTKSEVALEGLVTGTITATRFPPFYQTHGDNNRLRRQLVHASITFDRPVQGPLMLGTGRFVGLGLMCPMDGRTPRR